MLLAAPNRWCRKRAELGVSSKVKLVLPAAAKSDCPATGVAGEAGEPLTV